MIGNMAQTSNTNCERLTTDDPKSPTQASSGISSTHSALVIIPGTVNYFYNQTGRRIAEALEHLGIATEVKMLGDCPADGPRYDLCILSNLAEILHGFGEETAGLERLISIRRGEPLTLSLALDCVATVWFRRLHELGRKCGVDRLVDLGLQDQLSTAPAELSVDYEFVFNGLTPREILEVRAHQWAEPRPLPWAFVGHSTPTRAGLIDHLVSHVHPGGFVYAPGLAPYTESDSPHLNQKQFEQVLRRSEFQVWCSHHDHFYLEPERFRTSLLTGSVPIKVLDKDTSPPIDAPFRYLLMPDSELRERLNSEMFHRVREVHVQDWLSRSTLADGLAELLRKIGMGRCLGARAGMKISS